MQAYRERDGLDRLTRLIVAALLVGNLTLIIAIGWRAEGGGGGLLVLVPSLLFIFYVVIEVAVIGWLTEASRSPESPTRQEGQRRKRRSPRGTRRR